MLQKHYLSSYETKVSVIACTAQSYRNIILKITIFSETYKYSNSYNEFYIRPNPIIYYRVMTVSRNITGIRDIFGNNKYILFLLPISYKTCTIVYYTVWTVRSNILIII